MVTLEDVTNDRATDDADHRQSSGDRAGTAETAMDRAEAFKLRGNALFAQGKFREARELYGDALRTALGVDDDGDEDEDERGPDVDRDEEKEEVASDGTPRGVARKWLREPDSFARSASMVDSLRGEGRERAGSGRGLGERSIATRRRGGQVPDSVVVEPRAVRAPVHRDEEHQHDHERDGDESPASTGHRHGVKRPETDAAAPAARPGALQQRGVGMLKMHGEDASGTTTCVAGGETACGAGGARGRRLGRDERSPRVARARACAADDDATPTNAPIRRRSRDDDELAGRSSLSCAKKQNFAFPRLRLAPWQPPSALRTGTLR